MAIDFEGVNSNVNEIQPGSDDNNRDCLRRNILRSGYVRFRSCDRSGRDRYRNSDDPPSFDLLF